MDQTAYITPFVKSVQNVFETMLQLPVEIGQPSLNREPETHHDVSGIIGMSGDLDGTIVLSFATACAERVVSLFTATEMTQDHEDFADAVGELVNMVSGGAKAQFPGQSVAITTPSVVIGRGHQVYGRKDVVCITIPCSCDCGEFDVEVAVRQATTPAPAAGDAASV